MTKELKRFFIIATSILVVIIVVSQIFFLTFFETNHFPGRILCIGFVWLVTCVSHYRIMKTVTGNPRAFNRVFMLQTSIRLLLYMFCIVCYLFFFRQHAVAFTLHFLIVYFIFALFEVSSILKFVKR